MRGFSTIGVSIGLVLFWGCGEVKEAAVRSVKLAEEEVPALVQEVRPHPSEALAPPQSFRGFDLRSAPRTTNVSDLPELWEERPAGSKSYEIQDDVECVYSGLDGMVFHIKGASRFYIQSDPIFSSSRTFYGPFEGDPRRLLSLPEEGGAEEGAAEEG